MFKKIIFLLAGFQFAFSQCDEGFTYIEELPNSVTILSGDNCFSNGDLDALSSLISDNSLNYSAPLEVGTQTWVEGRLRMFVAGYYFGGVTSQLTVLPDNFGNLDDLRSLYLEWNLLTVLPESFSQLINLTSLYISNNYLTSLNDNIGDFQSLYFLDAGYNQIEYLPDSFVNLNSLQYCWLFNNQLTSLPEGFCNLNLNWDDMDWSWYPHFAIGGNQICGEVPECVLTSNHFEISLDQFYYAFPVYIPSECSTNNDGIWDVTDILLMINFIMDEDVPTDEETIFSDNTNDDIINVLDIVFVVNVIIGEQTR